MSITRRTLTAALSSAAIASAAGCASIPSSITALCPESLPSNVPAGRLTIDTHVHIFNGSDIQIREYINKVRAQESPELRGLGDILQWIGDAFAPSAAEEARGASRTERAARGSVWAGACEGLFLTPG